MFKKAVLVDAALFAGIVLLLLVVIPVLSSLLRQLVVLQIFIAIAGGLALGYVVRRIRNKVRE